MNWIDKKIAELGGLHEDEKLIPNKVLTPEEFELKYNLKLDMNFKDFIQRIGFKDFNDWIKTTTIDQIPIYSDKVCDYHKIYGFGFGNQGIEYLMDLTDQLIDSSKYIPFAEGASGDYICISIIPKSKGKIFYIHHESDDEDDLYLVANSIKDFLNHSFKDNQDDDVVSGDFIVGDFIDDYFD